MGQTLMAIVAEGKGGRVYLAPTTTHECRLAAARAESRPDRGAIDMREPTMDFTTPATD